MHRKGQVFSMPAKVSIGQDRNKKDPQRGRKHIVYVRRTVFWILIEIKKIPIGDGNITRMKNTLVNLIIFIQIKKLPLGDGNLIIIVLLSPVLGFDRN